MEPTTCCPLCSSPNLRPYCTYLKLSLYCTSPHRYPSSELDSLLHPPAPIPCWMDLSLAFPRKKTWTCTHQPLPQALLSQVFPFEPFSYAQATMCSEWQSTMGPLTGFLSTLTHQLDQSFDMKDLGPLIYFLGIEVHQKRHRLRLSQTKYISELLMKSDMAGCKLIGSPASKDKLSPSDGPLLTD